MAKALAVRINILVTILVVLTAIQVVNSLMAGKLGMFGIIPRDTSTWYHIFTAPLLHVGWGHLLNNLFGLALFGFITLMNSVRYFVAASLFINIVTGILVWCFARSSIHLGASGWIFGLWSLSIMAAWFDHNIKNLMVAVLVIFFYGGMIYGVLPTQPGVSFESHLFGALSGAVFAALAAKYKPLKKAIR